MTTAVNPTAADNQVVDEPVPMVRFPFPRDDGSLTPYSFELGYPLVTLVYDTLLWRDEDGIAQPWLAEAVEPSADGRRLTVRLVAGARWQDGVPLTAADVAFTFRFVAERHHPRFSAEVRAVEQVQVVDEVTMVITLRHASPGFRDQPLADLPILPAHLWQQLPAGQAAPVGLPVGSGPYRLVEHRPGEGYRFEANLDYFRGRPAVAALEVPIIGDAEESLDALEQRRVDMLPLSLPRGAAARVQGLATEVRRGPSYLGTVLALNLRRPPFDRPEARQAVAAALDLRQIANAVGDAVPADRGYLHPDSPWAPRGALHHFEPAGQQLLVPLDLPLVEVLAPDNDPTKVEAARQVALALEGAGARAEAKMLPSDDLALALGEDGSTPSFTAAIVTSPRLASYDPDFLGRLFGSDPTDAPLNVSGYRSVAFDQLVGRIGRTVEPEARRDTVEDALRLLATDAPVVPLFFSTGAYAYRQSVYEGWVFVKGSGILDKRSFVEPRRSTIRPTPPGAEPPRVPEGTVWRRLLFIGVGAFGAIVAIGLVAWRRR